MAGIENDLIAFIILGDDDAAFKDCVEHLQRLVCPEGMRVMCIRAVPERGAAHAWQNAAMRSSARYKIYLGERTRITNRRFLTAVMAAFAADDAPGIVGAMGAVSLGAREWQTEFCGAVAAGDDERVYVYNRGAGGAVPAVMLCDSVVATRVDVPWRAGLFQSAEYAVRSLSMEYRRHGYGAAVLPASGIWCAMPERGAEGEYDRRLFEAEYAPELAGEFFKYQPGHHYEPQTEYQLDSVRAAASKCIRLGQFENAIAILGSAGNTFYTYNQFLRDETIESLYTELADAMRELYPNDLPRYEPDENSVLFYDGFGLDVRGLANIYLTALAGLGYKIIYVVSEKARANIQTPLKILNSAPVKPVIAYLPSSSNVATFRGICEAVAKCRPARGFLYSAPWDGAGTLAFTRLAGHMKRYQINLTDHAFWPGLNAFDLCLEFRNTGGTLSRQYRRISGEKLLLQPYYPIYDDKAEFQGFPFKREKGDFVLFSGGSLYKTYDDEMTYYKLIDWVLATFRQVKFWYAGFGDDAGLSALLKKYPGRAVYTSERKDLFQVMQNVDLYLNTYPIGGGLMIQYSAMAGTPPFTLMKYGPELDGGILLDQDKLGVYFSSVDAIKKGIRRFITDKKYRATLEANMKGAVTTPEKFQENLGLILREGKSAYELRPGQLDLTNFMKDYYDRFQRKNKK